MPAELSGLVVVDKPEGISSAGVVSKVKKLFGARKVGHTGTLDPFATGVLICCINKATRLSRFLVKGDKEYDAQMVLGVETDTQDATGSIIRRRPIRELSDEKIRETAKGFVGALSQVPPAYSALKHCGTPLYKLARRGVPVEKPPRPVRVYRLSITDIRLPLVGFSVVCSSGTYVRTLCADMGRKLGCGGHLAKLRRTMSCGYTLADAFKLEEMARYRNEDHLAQVLISMNDALPTMPAAIADDRLARQIRNGMKLTMDDFPSPQQGNGDDLFKVVDRQGSLIAILASSPETDRYNYCCVFQE